MFYAPLWIARESGYFDQRGIDAEIEVFDSAEKITDALKNGAVQIAISTPEGVIVDAYQNGPIRIIAGNARRLPHFVIARPDYKTPDQLRGANFGVLSLNEGTTYLVRQYAQSIGLKPDEYKITQVGGAPTRWRLLQEGKIDAGLQPFPLSYQAEAKGFTNFGAIAKIVPDWQFTSVNVRQDWAVQNRAVVEKALQALMQGSTTMRADPELASRIAARELRTTAELASRALEDTQKMDILSPDWSVSESGLHRVFESLMETQQLKPGTTFNFNGIVDATFLSGAQTKSK